MEYHIDFRKVKTTKGKIEFDVWVTSRSCVEEYIGQYKSLKQAHKTIRMMLEQGILF